MASAWHRRSWLCTSRWWRPRKCRAGGRRAGGLADHRFIACSVCVCARTRWLMIVCVLLAARFEKTTQVLRKAVGGVIKYQAQNYHELWLSRCATGCALFDVPASLLQLVHHHLYSPRRPTLHVHGDGGASCVCVRACVRVAGIPSSCRGTTRPRRWSSRLRRRARRRGGSRPRRCLSATAGSAPSDRWLTTTRSEGSSSLQCSGQHTSWLLKDAPARLARSQPFPFALVYRTRPRTQRDVPARRTRGLAWRATHTVLSDLSLSPLSVYPHPHLRRQSDAHSGDWDSVPW
jgi:hypothetical protein